MRRWLILLLLLSLATAQPHAEDVLGARLDATFRPAVDAANVTEAYNLITAPEEALTDGCHDRGAFRYDGQAVRFEEQRDQAGCGEFRVNLTLPAPVDEVTIQFQANREINQASRDGRFLLPPDNAQRFRIYGADGQLAREFSVFADNHPHAPADERFVQTIDISSLGTNLTLGWYFEDVGTTLTAVTGGTSGRQFLARVHDIRVDITGVPVDLSLLAGATRMEGDIQYDVLTTALFIEPGWAGNETRLTLNHLDRLQPLHVDLPDGTRLDTQALDVAASGSQHRLSFPIMAPGSYAIHMEGTTFIPAPPPMAPTQLGWLLIAALSTCSVLYVGATIHQGLFHREHARHQRRTVTRKNLEIVALGLFFGAFTGYLLGRQNEAMTTLPITGVPLGFYALLAFFGLLCIIHLGIGILRRSYARDLRHAEQLEGANKVLERSNRDLEQFAYVASHDLQEPLRKVASFTSLLDRRYEAHLDERGRKYVHNAHDAAVRARQLIKDLLAFSRIGQDHPKEPVDLNRLIREARVDLERPLSASGGHLEIDALPTVLGSPPLLRQLFVNLVGNAIKYRHPERAPEVHVFATKGRTAWTIHVQDNGLGIAKEHQAQVFQIFQRLHGRGSDYDGSGIGLAICQRIVEYHGGDIGLRSTQGSGSDFYVTFPIRKQDG